MKVYLGDGVYAKFEGPDLILTTEDGIRVTNTIVLEPEVWASLSDYMEQQKSPRVYGGGSGGSVTGHDGPKIKRVRRELDFTAHGVDVEMDGKKL